MFRYHHFKMRPLPGTQIPLVLREEVNNPYDPVIEDLLDAPNHDDSGVFEQDVEERATVSRGKGGLFKRKHDPGASEADIKKREAGALKSRRSRRKVILKKKLQEMESPEDCNQEVFRSSKRVKQNT